MKLRGAIILVTFGGEQPLPALRRAFALSRVLQRDLRILRVEVAPPFGHPLFPEVDLGGVVVSAEAQIELDGETGRWCSSFLGRAVPVEGLHVPNGDVVEGVSERVAELGAEIVVLAASSGIGDFATALAIRSALPVLVARAMATDESILAATDLEREDYPVLRRAAALAEQLDAPIVAVHNATPRASLVGFAPTWPGMVLTAGTECSWREEHLRRATRDIGIEGDHVVAHELDAVDAILHEARARRADVVVVGTRRLSWFARLVGRSVAADVAETAQRSVLVTPLPS